MDIEDQYAVVKRVGKFEIVRVEDYETPVISNPDKFIFYVCYRPDKDDGKFPQHNLYLWKSGKLEEGVGCGPQYSGIYKTYAECPGIFNDQSKAEECLETYLKSKETTNAK